MLRLRNDRDRYLLCGRAGCFTVLARLEPAYWDPSEVGYRWIRQAALEGSGWYQDRAARWTLGHYARDRVRRGKRAQPSHQRVTSSIEVDLAAGYGYDPATSELLRGVPRGRPSGLVVLAKSGSSHWLQVDDRVVCPECGSVSTATIEELRCPPEQEVRLRAEGLWGWNDEPDA